MQDVLLPGVEHVPKYVEEKGMETTMLSIPSISCHHCIMTIKRESGLVAGADFVSADVEARTATFQIESDRALAALKATLAEAGYPVAGA